MKELLDRETPSTSQTAPHRPRIGWYRWVICGLLFFATTINYMDRQVLGVLKTTLMGDFQWSEIHYARVILAFQFAYAFGYVLGGRLMDRIGVRKGFALAVVVWSAAAMAHGLVRPLVDFGLPWLETALAGLGLGGLTATMLSAVGFGTARCALGLSEGGNFPASIKTVGEWFPKQERALATGIFNAGSNVGAILVPLVVPWITFRWGWPTAFYATGALGFVWLVAWLLIYRSPEEDPRVSPAELAYIRSDPADPPSRIPWLQLLRYRQTWAYTIAMFLVSPVWWFYLYWAPGFLHDQHGIDLMNIGLPLVTIYLLADVGSIGGGWLSSWLIKRGATINFARKMTLLACALCVVPVCMASVVTTVWSAVILIGLAAAAHQGFSANLYTIVSDTVPRKAVSSVVGIGGMAGAFGGMLMAEFVGQVLNLTKTLSGRPNYLVLFIVAASAYLLALAIIHLMLPRLEVMNEEKVRV
jgi:MFS transporter, ACS family, hexuronate transporter